MREQVSPIVDEPSSTAAEPRATRGLAATPLPPEWAREEPARATGGFRTSALLTVAVLGWLVAAALLIYSHGQADRVRTTEDDMRSRVGALTHDLTLARTVQDYLSTPNLKILPFRALRPVPANSLVTLIMSPTYLHVVIVARWLAPLQSNQVYAVWARDRGGLYTPLGVLTHKGPIGDYAAVVAGAHTIDYYRNVYVSVEYGHAGRKPAGPLLFGARITRQS